MERAVTNEDFLTVSEVATRLRVKSSWVYGHADELGAYRLGKYLRFSWDRVLERLERRDGN
jgi:excisionase family DNA binding protein